MTKIIGYAKAKALMQEGYRVLEVPRFRGFPDKFLQSPDGKLLSDRIRSDSWDKLRQECHLVEKQYHGKRNQHVNSLWAYGAVLSWECAFWNPGTGETKTAIVHAVTHEEAETKALANACGWHLTCLEAIK